MSIFLKVLHLTFSVTFFLPFGFVNIITKAQKAFEIKYSWKEFFIMANRIMLNQTSYHGAGAIQEIANEAKAHGFKKAFVCSDPDLVKFKVTAKVTDILTANGLDYELYSDIKANPTIQNVQHGVEAFKASGADYLIAIGGGSSMDTSKAIGIIIANPEFEDVRSLEGVAPTKKPCVPIIAVPTTAGTAAEVTINYVITDIERKRKFVCVDPHDMPIIAIVDPDMMSSMPKGLTASTGMDALTHAIEGYTTKAAWEMTDKYPLKSHRDHLKIPWDGCCSKHKGRPTREWLSVSTIAGMGLLQRWTWLRPLHGHTPLGVQLLIPRHGCWPAQLKLPNRYGNINQGMHRRNIS